METALLISYILLGVLILSLLLFGAVALTLRYHWQRYEVEERLRVRLIRWFLGVGSIFVVGMVLSLALYLAL